MYYSYFTIILWSIEFYLASMLQKPLISTEQIQVK